MMFWKIYFWVITGLVFLAFTSEGFKNVWEIVDLLIAIPAFTGLFAYSYKKRLLTVKFWKRYFPLYLTWDLTYNLFIYPFTTGEPFDGILLIGLAIVIPFYVALYRYAFIFFEAKENANEVTDQSEQGEETVAIQYPTIATRYLSTFIDGVLLLTVFFIASYLFQQDSDISKIVRVSIILGTFFIYEPLCTSKYCTIGQKIMGIRVRTFDTCEKISLFSAYTRIIVKMFLGIISFFTIPFTNGKRALHDFAVQSIVIYAHQDKKHKYENV